MKEFLSQTYIYVFLVIVGAFVISFLFRKVLNFYTKKTKGLLRVDQTSAAFVKNSISFIIYIIAVFFIFTHIPFLNKASKALFAGAGILAAIIGFASQKALTNIFSGVFIITFRPFRVGDIVEIETYKGIVEDVTLRHTVIRNYENRRIIIPNSIISEKTIVNSSIGDEKIKRFIEFSIGYTADVKKAMAIIKDEAIGHPLTLDLRTKDEVREGNDIVPVKLISWDAYSITLRAYVWAKNNDDAFSVYCDLLAKVKERFDNEGIEIPYPYQNIIIRKS